MWERIYNFGRILFNLGTDLRENRTNTERLERELREVTLVVQRLVFELQRVRENQAHELEKMELRLKLEMLQATRQLPPETQSKD